MKCRPGAEKEGRAAEGFDSQLGECLGVQRLERSVSRFDMQVSKANAELGKHTLPLSPLLGGGTDTIFILKAVPDPLLIQQKRVELALNISTYIK